MTWEYVAGFIDGEGSIVKRGETYRLYVSQTNKNVLDRMKEFIGRGHIYPVTKRKPHWKNAWVYMTTSHDDTLYVLSHVVGKLIVKKEVAFCALNEMKNREARRKKTKAIQQERIAMARKMRNKKWSYRKIGKELGIDWGYVRRLIIFKKS